MLTQSFYIYQLGEHLITERFTHFEGDRLEKLDIPGWKGWLDDLVMSGEHPF